VVHPVDAYFLNKSSLQMEMQDFDSLSTMLFQKNCDMDGGKMVVSECKDSR
jgi:hypothetical protein